MTASPAAGRRAPSQSLPALATAFHWSMRMSGSNQSMLEK
jgi:hypothetical protein